MLRNCYNIEFIGGPYDGHVETSDCRPIHLAVDVVFLVCENALRLLNGTEPRPGRSRTSVALYELQQINGNLRHQFVDPLWARNS